MDHCDQDGGQDRDGLDLVTTVDKPIDVPVPERIYIFPESYKLIDIT